MYSLFNEFVEIESSKYLLRRIVHTDSKDIFEMYGDADVMKFNLEHKINSVDETKKLIDIIHTGFENKWFIRWGVIEKNTNKYIGDLALHHFNEKENKVQIGYMSKKPYWNKGIMSEVSQLLIDYINKNTSIQIIEASIYPENIASIKLAKKLGFQFKGFLEDKATQNKSRVIYSKKLK
ncbi:MAG: GNAT family N-acetyltransferase [Romboutsia sp.]